MPGIGRAQAAATLKIGVLTDMSGPYKDLAGPVAVQCVTQALEDFGVSGKGMKVEVLTADHQNKPDVGATIARAWADRDGVDLIIEVANSGVALAVAGVAKEKNKGLRQHWRRDIRSHGRAMQFQHAALGVRHVHASEIDRCCDGQGRRG